MKTQMAVMTALSLFASTSVALAKAEAPAEKAADKPAAAAPSGPPKPPAENDMFKKSSGVWTCEGTGKSPDGTEMKFKSSWTIKSTLGGQWYTVVYKRANAAPRPSFEGDATIGYDLSNKRYWMVGFDNMGGWINLTSTDNSVYMGESGHGDKKVNAKFTFTPGKDKSGKESEKLFDVTLEFGGGASAHESCKK